MVFSHPFEKYAQVKLDHFPRVSGWKKNIRNHNLDYMTPIRTLTEGHIVVTYTWRIIPVIYTLYTLYIRVFSSVLPVQNPFLLASMVQLKIRTKQLMRAIDKTSNISNSMIHLDNPQQVFQHVNFGFRNKQDLQSWFYKLDFLMSSPYCQALK